MRDVVTSLCKNPSIKLILSQERKVMLSFLKCSSCQECMTITGMFSSVVCVSCCRTQVVKIRERRYRHVECYTCRDCGFSLMERGHFCVDEELYTPDSQWPPLTPEHLNSVPCFSMFIIKYVFSSFILLSLSYIEVFFVCVCNILNFEFLFKYFPF